MHMPDVGERGAVISGIGQSDVGRRLHRHPLDLTLDACLAAIEDYAFGFALLHWVLARWVRLEHPA